MSGKRVAWYFVAFFGFIATVNAVMVTLAMRTHSGTVTDHPYEKGLAYNKVVEAEKKQGELGWTDEISYVNGMLIFTLKDQNGLLITPEKTTANITRPAQQGMDFTVTLNTTQTPITFPAKGIWNVRVDAMARDKHYQQSKRIVVQ